MKIGLGSIFQSHGLEFLAKNHEHLSFQQKRAINAISKCRTGELGQSIYKCSKCQKVHVSNGSCSNRNCPLCQGHKTVAWVEAQQQKRLPVEYYLVTFTVPSELRDVIKQLGVKAYNLMFKASAEVIREIMANPKNLGVTDVGFTSTLHTWNSQLQNHPHVHIILPGGGLTDEGEWKSFPPGLHSMRGKLLYYGKANCSKE